VGTPLHTPAREPVGVMIGVNWRQKFCLLAQCLPSSAPKRPLDPDLTWSSAAPPGEEVEVLVRHLIAALQTDLSCKNTNLLTPADTCNYRKDVGKMWARILAC